LTDARGKSEGESLLRNMIYFPGAYFTKYIGNVLPLRIWSKLGQGGETRPESAPEYHGTNKAMPKQRRTQNSQTRPSDCRLAYE
jgi:hypothetical protein